MLRMRFLTLALAFALAPALAHADAIGPGPACPPGSRPYASHGGRYCGVFECANEACADGATCRAWRVCTREIQISSGGGRSQIPSSRRTVQAVAATCAPEAQCDGTEEPPAPGAQRSGPITCREVRACVAPPLPPLPGLEPPRARPIRRASPASAPPRAESRAAGCSVAPNARASVSLLVTFALLLFASRRRAFAAALPLLFVVAPAHAQPLANGFHVYEHPGSLMEVRALACSRDRAFVRSWMAELAVWNGTSFTRVERPAGEARGAEISASPQGHVFLTGWDQISRWDGRAWSAFRFEARPRSLSGIFALSDTEVYATAPGRILFLSGETFRAYDAGTWREIVQVAGSSRSDLWIATEGPLVLRHDGRAWHRIALPPTVSSVQALFVLAPNNAWIVASSQVLHWDGSAWQPRNDGLPSGGIQAIGGRRDHIYGVGTAGVARWSGAQWTIELPASAFPPDSYPALTSVCTTDRHLLVANTSGSVLVRPL